VIVSVCGYSQDNEATVTIVGNPVNIDNIGNQFNNVNVYQTNDPPPPAQQQFANPDQNIEPTLENGFHMRFQLESPGSVERISGVSSSYSGGSSSAAAGRSRKHTTSLAQKSFNFKKKLKKWIPERKKKYHPTLCEKFR
jgi:hypothetical protein